MHKNSELLFRKYATKHFEENQKVFEIAPAPIYKKIIKEKVNTLEYFYGDLRNYTLDDSEAHYVKFNGEYSVDIQDNFFDIVFCGQVLEHVRKPWIWVKELARTIKQNGKIILINPISYGYHRDPVDCWRIYPEGIKALFEEAKIKCEFSTFESLDGKVTDTFSVGIKI